MKKHEFVQAILKDQYGKRPVLQSAKADAPVNIALVKYWGKRNQELNLPMTSSLSVGLPSLRCYTQLTVIDDEKDQVVLDGSLLASDDPFVVRLIQFVDLFRGASTWRLKIETRSDVAIAAGLASSASGFAAMVLALDRLFDWNLSKQDLSMLARIGSGSASRSLWDGFVEWHAGQQDDGMDSYAEPIEASWPDLCISVLNISAQAKPISSRLAMQHTIETSLLYESWPKQVKHDSYIIKNAIKTRDFEALGQAAEQNALAMHATMLAAQPAIQYCLPDTLGAMQKVWDLRENGFKLYFTQDAGPNLKLLFLSAHKAELKAIFKDLEIIEPFA